MIIRLKKISITRPLNEQNAQSQAMIAIVLLSVIPILSFFYLGARLHGESGRSVDYSETIVFACTLLVAFCGYRILRKYPKNIINLRRYVEEIAAGSSLRQEIHLDQSECSDDLKFIEKGFNTILVELANRLKIIEQKYQAEARLRKALEEQQQILMHAEQHRAMVQSIGAACHHLGQPATALRMHLFLLKEHAHSMEEIEEIEQSVNAVDLICDILRRLREVSEFRTEPYISEGDSQEQILAI